MKRVYMKPDTQAVHINICNQLLSGSPVNSIGGNVFDGTPEGGSGVARGRQGGWDEDDNF